MGPGSVPTIQKPVRMGRAVRLSSHGAHLAQLPNRVARRRTRSRHGRKERNRKGLRRVGTSANGGGLGRTGADWGRLGRTTPSMVTTERPGPEGNPDSRPTGTLSGLVSQGFIVSL